MQFYKEILCGFRELSFEIKLYTIHANNYHQLAKLDRAANYHFYISHIFLHITCSIQVCVAHVGHTETWGQSHARECCKGKRRSKMEYLLLLKRLVVNLKAGPLWFDDRAAHSAASMLNNACPELTQDLGGSCDCVRWTSTAGGGFTIWKVKGFYHNCVVLIGQQSLHLVRAALPTGVVVGAVRCTLWTGTYPVALRPPTGWLLPAEGGSGARGTVDHYIEHTEWLACGKRRQDRAKLSAVCNAGSCYVYV